MALARWPSLLGSVVCVCDFKILHELQSMGVTLEEKGFLAFVLTLI